MTNRVVCKCNKVNFIGVENDKILNFYNIWYYPSSMKHFNSFTGQWKIKYK